MTLAEYGELISFFAGIIAVITSVYVRNFRDDRKEVKEEIYSNLYDEFSEVSNQGLVVPNRVSSGFFTTEWRQLEPNEKIKIDGDLRKQLDRYHDHLDELTELVEAVDKEIIAKGEQTDLLRKIDNQYCFLPISPNEQVSPHSNSFMLPLDWLERYSDILIKSDGPENLHKEMRRFDKRSNVGPKSSKFWSEEHYELIWEAFLEAKKRWLATHQYESVEELVNKLEIEAEEVGENLENKLNYSWLDPRF